VKPSETAQDIVNRCVYLFNLHEPTSNDTSINNSRVQSITNLNQIDSITTTYQLWLKTSKNEPLIPLIGKYLKNENLF
jgi:hypothetical protein